MTKEKGETTLGAHASSVHPKRSDEGASANRPTNKPKPPAGKTKPPATKKPKDCIAQNNPVTITFTRRITTPNPITDTKGAERQFMQRGQTLTVEKAQLALVPPDAYKEKK